MVSLLGTQVDLSKTIVVLHRRLRINVLNGIAEIERYNCKKANLHFLHFYGDYDLGNINIQKILWVSVYPLKSTTTKASRGQQYA